MSVTRIARSALLLGFGLLLGAGSAEIAARVYAHVGGQVAHELAERDPEEVLYEPHGEFGYRQKPNHFQQFGNGTRSNWNAMGYRGPLVAREKPAGTFRVVLLGESTTEGFGVEDDQTIDAHMRDLLHARYPGIRVEVVNLALGGYDSYQIFQRMKSDGVGFSPDVVIVNSGINDVRNAQFSDLHNPDPRTLIWEGNMERMRQEAANGGPSLWTRLLHHSYAARLPGFFLENLERRDSIARSQTLAPHPQALDYFETNIRRTADLARGIGAGVILSTPPSSLSTRYAPTDFSDRGYWIIDGKTTEEYRQRLAERLVKLAVEFTASGWPVPYLGERLPPEMFLDDCHLTSAGNRAMAQAFVEALEPQLKRAFPAAVARAEGG
jgi:lysophospholipase L1-like esterase